MRTHLALLATAASFVLLPAAQAQTAPEVEANVAFVSDYRFRGVSLSDETLALQGGLDLGFDSGLYVGAWGSSIEQVGDSEVEVDLYAGYGAELTEGLSFDVGVLAYVYPGQEDTAYGEVYASLTGATGIVESSVGVAYAPEQDNIGNDDNLYVFYSGSAPLGESGLGLVFGVGYETGAFGDPDGDGDDKIDWTLGLTASGYGLDWGLAYVDTSEEGEGVESQVVLSVGKSF
jgi:uncharacterized protein (TIGR02001 family)